MRSKARRNNIDALAKLAASYSLDRIIAVGPLLHGHPRSEHPSRTYFIAAFKASELTTAATTCVWLRCWGATADDRERFIAEIGRQRLAGDSGPPIGFGTHTFENELDLARFCDARWPCEQTAIYRREAEQQLNPDFKEQ